MHRKKLAVFGIAALIVFAGIFAAGCTSSDYDPIIGSWGKLCSEEMGGAEIATFFDDGTGTGTMRYILGDTEEKTFTWIKTGKKTYKVEFDSGTVLEAKYVNDNSELEWTIINLEDPIIGIHTSVYEKNGNTVSDMTAFKKDNTGVSVATYTDSSTSTETTDEFTWRKIGSNTYVMIYKNGDRWIATYDKDDNSLNYQKIDYSGDPILGTHTIKGDKYGVDGTITTTLNANGTGNEVQKTKAGNVHTYTFTWVRNDAFDYTLYYNTYNIWGVWKITYNPVTGEYDTILDHYLWVDNYRTDDKHRLDIHATDENSGIAYEYDGDGNLEEYKTTWEEIKENVYKVTYSDGNVWYCTYRPASRTYDWKESNI